MEAYMSIYGFQNKKPLMAFLFLSPPKNAKKKILRDLDQKGD